MRGEFSGSAIKRIKQSIKKNGFDHDNPIEIAIINGKRIIIDGHHRARAAGAAGYRNVPVIIRELTPEKAAKFWQQALEAAQNLGTRF